MTYQPFQESENFVFMIPETQAINLARNAPILVHTEGVSTNRGRMGTTLPLSSYILSLQKKCNTASLALPSGIIVLKMRKCGCP
jgi:hypothetical protein